MAVAVSHGWRCVDWSNLLGVAGSRCSMQLRT
jgi:hypothetical protein